MKTLAKLIAKSAIRVGTLIGLGLLSAPAQALNITNTSASASSTPASAGGGVYEGTGEFNWQVGNPFIDPNDGQKKWPLTGPNGYPNFGNVDAGTLEGLIWPGVPAPENWQNQPPFGVPWETDALPVVGSTILFGLGVWAKRKFAKPLQK